MHRDFFFPDSDSPKPRKGIEYKDLHHENTGSNSIAEKKGDVKDKQWQENDKATKATHDEKEIKCVCART